MEKRKTYPRITYKEISEDQIKRSEQLNIALKIKKVYKVTLDLTIENEGLLQFLASLDENTMIQKFVQTGQLIINVSAPRIFQATDQNGQYLTAHHNRQHDTEKFDSEGQV